MRTMFGRFAPLAGLVLVVGCAPGAGNQSKVAADFPLFTNTDGSATLAIRLVDARQRTQDFADLEGTDRVRFTLSSATRLTTSRVASDTVTIGPSQSFSNISSFAGLRPGTDYYLKADLYKQSDLTSESSFTQNIVRGEGIGGPLTLNAGAVTTATIKINSVGSIAFSNSTSSNVVSDFVVVENDTLTVDTGMTSTNNPLVRRIEVVFRSANGSQRGTTMSTTTITGTNTTFSWTVPTYITTGSQDLGTLHVYGYDATSGGNQIAYKTKAITVYKGASITPATLN